MDTITSLEAGINCDISVVRVIHFFNLLFVFNLNKYKFAAKI